jgi:hypothetical protein
MTKRILTILFLTFFITSKVFACDCKVPKSLKAIQDREFENSECIFIGEVFKIDTDKNTFEIKVIESFRGNKIGTVHIGIYDQLCGPVIDEKGKWLIYGNYNSDNLIEINACGISRSFGNPEYNTLATRPPKPISPNEKESESQAEKKRAEWKLKAKSDLENEIADLRKRTE